MNKIEEKIRKHITDEDTIQAILSEFETDNAVYHSFATDIFNYIWHNYNKSPHGKVQRKEIASMVKSMWNKS